MDVVIKQRLRTRETLVINVNIRELTQQEGRMTQKCRERLGMQSRATFFRHSAVLSLPAVLLRKLPNIMK